MTTLKFSLPQQSETDEDCAKVKMSLTAVTMVTSATQLVSVLSVSLLGNNVSSDVLSHLRQRITLLLILQHYTY